MYIWSGRGGMYSLLFEPILLLSWKGNVIAMGGIGFEVALKSATDDKLHILQKLPFYSLLSIELATHEQERPIGRFELLVIFCQSRRTTQLPCCFSLLCPLQYPPLILPTPGQTLAGLSADLWRSEASVCECRGSETVSCRYTHSCTSSPCCFIPW